MFDVRWERCSVDRFAYGFKFLLCPSKVGVRAEGCREGCTQVSSRECFVMYEDPYALPPQGDVGQPDFEGVVPVRFWRRNCRL